MGAPDPVGVDDVVLTSSMLPVGHHPRARPEEEASSPGAWSGGGSSPGAWSTSKASAPRSPAKRVIWEGRRSSQMLTTPRRRTWSGCGVGGGSRPSRSRTVRVRERPSRVAVISTREASSRGVSDR
ncbi:hypothetical protein [Ornithinimicrobium kibberense]|uniref:hypothetical protein n=1 Tax=Ornithinimicrobium kibberense TaxID=282060 RepID=UPI00360CAF9B